jgi:hypothetical protein
VQTSNSPASKPAKLFVALAADAEELDLFALIDQRKRALARQPHDRRIECAGQTAFAGADQEQMNLIVAGSGQQRRRSGRARRCSGNVGDHRVHFLRVGPRRFGDGLRAAQF